MTLNINQISYSRGGTYVRNFSFVATEARKHKRFSGVVEWKHLPDEVRDLLLTSVSGLFGADPTKGMPSPGDLISQLMASNVISAGSCNGQGKYLKLTLPLCCKGGNGKTLKVAPLQIALSLRDRSGKTRVRLNDFGRPLPLASF